MLKIDLSRKKTVRGLFNGRKSMNDAATREGQHP